MESDGTRNKLHSLEDVSSLLGGTSVWTLRKHIAVGNIRVTRLGRRVFVDGSRGIVYLDPPTDLGRLERFAQAVLAG